MKDVFFCINFPASVGILIENNVLGGVLVDEVFEPFMALQAAGSFWTTLFGMGKGTGAALLFFVIALVGVLTCLVFRKDPHIWRLEETQMTPYDDMAENQRIYKKQ